jgi:hypothetical protein
MSIDITDIILFLYPDESITFTYENGETLNISYLDDTRLKIDQPGLKINNYTIQLSSAPYILQDTRMPKEIFLQREQDIIILETPKQITEGILKLQKERFKSSLKDTILKRGYILRDTDIETIKRDVKKYKSLKYRPDKNIFEKIEEYTEKIHEIKKEIEKSENHIAQLTKILESSDRDKELSLKKPLAGLRYKRELLEKYTQRLNRYRELVNRKTFTVSRESKKVSAKIKKSPEILTQAVDKFKNCDFKLYERLWNDIKNYGPLIASLIFGGCLKTKAIMPSLMKVWIEFRNTITDIAKKLSQKKSKIPLFVRIYEELVSKETNCYFKKGSINFLTDLYIDGSCNCQCGTYLGYILSEMFPEPGFQVFPVHIDAHIYLIIFDKEKNIFQFETTGVMDFYKPLNGQKFRDEFLNIFGNEQLLGLFAIDQSIPYQTERMGTDLFLDMIDYDSEQADYLKYNYEDKDALLYFKKGFSTVNKILIKTPLDITTLVNLCADHIFGVKLSLPILKSLKPLQLQYLSEVVDGKTWTKEELEREWKIILNRF